MFTTFEASAFLKNCCSIFNNISFKQVERRREEMNNLLPRDNNDPRAS